MKKIPESLLIGEERKGRGSIIYFVDNVEAFSLVLGPWEIIFCKCCFLSEC